MVFIIRVKNQEHSDHLYKEQEFLLQEWRKLMEMIFMVVKVAIN
jgi:hypothetical protein